MANFNFLEFLQSLSKVAKNLNSSNLENSKTSNEKQKVENNNQKTSPYNATKKQQVGVICEMLKNHDRRASEINENYSKK